MAGLGDQPTLAVPLEFASLRAPLKHLLGIPVVRGQDQDTLGPGDRVQDAAHLPVDRFHGLDRRL